MPTTNSHNVRVSSHPEVVSSKSPWRTASGVVWIMLRNASVSVAWVWLTTYCSSRGNVFSSQSLAQQSFVSFVIANEFWCEVLFFGVVLLAEIVGLMKERFIVYPDRAPTFLFCASRLLRRTLPQLFVYLATLAVVAWLFDSVIPRWWLDNKFHVYAMCTCCHVYFSHTVLATRTIYNTETVGGSNKFSSRSSSFMHSYRRNLWRTIRGHYHTYGFVILTTISVQITSLLQFKCASDILIYMAVTYLVKLLIQALAKYLMFRRKVNDIRTMAVAVGLPTVLIDTQVRIVIQRLQGTGSSSITGVLGLAVAEIVVRALKVVHLKFEIHRAQNTVLADPVSLSDRSASESVSRVESNEKVSQLLAFYTAELYADMLAEYVAMGSSIAIIVFYWDHPKYHLSKAQGSDGLSLSSNLDIGSIQSFCLQIVLEMFVDYVACLVEIRGGVSFHELGRYVSFISVVFVSIATINIQISALMYLETPS